MGLNDDLWNYIESGCASLTKVKEYIKEGADVNYEKRGESYKCTCIMVACDALSSYIKNIKNNNTDIYTSNLYEYFLIIKFLLERRADANTMRRFGYEYQKVCALELVISSIYKDISYRKEIIKSAVLYYDSNYNTIKINKSVLLSYIDKLYFNIIKLLLEYGADPNCINGDFLKERVIPYCNCDFNVIDIVVGVIIDMKKNMKNGVEVINIVKQGNLEKFMEYTRQGCIVYSDSSDKSTLMYACENGNYEMALALISAGADINTKDVLGKTVLNYAAKGGNTKIMELLLAQGADNGTKK